MLIHSQNSKNQLTQYDFVNEPRENFSKIVMPLNREISITSPYGTRMHPIFGASKFHNGIDLAANYENVYSVLDGIVTETGWDNKVVEIISKSNTLTVLKPLISIFQKFIIVSESL
jgi:murein DD-endopeptidase MepM/ murein hydrolase activator NlpD